MNNLIAKEAVMQGRNRVFDDAARVAGGAFGALSGVRREIEGAVRQQLERMLSRMDLVTRDEFETVREMAVRARMENEMLQERLDALEAAAKPKTAPRRKTGTSAKKSGSKSDKADD